MNSGEGPPPLLLPKDYTAPSVFQPVNLLRESRRQRSLPDVSVPVVALLDPDGDVVRYLSASGAGRRHPGWACYHTEMWTVDVDGVEIGVVGLAVGAPFAVLVAEQLFASGAEILVSVTSAGQVAPLGSLPRLVLIVRAVRDEGTSLHYLPPSTWSELDLTVSNKLAGSFDGMAEPVTVGSSWTTDAPYRETAAAIEAARALGVVCVEMEAAALYAYATAAERTVVCFAHVTNSMATDGEDFEKGVDDGVQLTLAAVRAVVAALA